MKENLSNDELIREHKRIELFLEGERAILEMIATGKPLHEILEAIALHYEANAQDAICSILLINKAGTHIKFGAGPNLPDAYNKGIYGEPIGPAAGSCGTAAFRKERVIVPDIANDPLWESYREFTLSFGLKACWSTPILGSANNVLGTFAIYYREPRSPTSEDLFLVDKISNLAKIALKRYYKEVQLKESEELYRSTVNRITDGFISLDTNWCYTYMNKAAGEILRHDHEKAIGKNIWKVFPEGIDQPFKKAFEKAMANQQYVHFEEYSEPYQKWFENHIYPSPEGVSIYFRDITHKKSAELKIKGVNEQIELIAKATNDVIWDWNLLTGEVKWNEKYNTLFGYAPLPFYDVTSWTNGILPEDRDRVFEGIHKVINSKEKLWRDDYRCVKQDGTILYIHDRGFVLHDASGNPYRMIGSMLDITERKKAELEIISERNLSDSIINSLPGIFYHLDEHGNYIRWNKQKEIISGYTSDEMSRMNALDFFDASGKELIHAKIKEVLEKGSTNVEVQLVTKSKQKIWFYFAAVAADYDGRKTIIGSGIDISDRKRAELELMESEAKYRTLVEQAADGIFIVEDPSLQFVEVNKKICEMLGYTAEELLRKKIVEVVNMDPEQPPIQIDKIRAGEPILRERKFICKDGTTIPVEVSGIRMENGNYLGIVRDISERKIAALNLKESEERHRSIVEQSLTGIYIVQDGYFIYTNPQFAKIFGYSQEEILTSIRAEDIVFEPDREMVNNTVIQRLKDGEEKPNYRFRGIKKDGTVIHVEVFASKAMHAGQPVTVGTLLDITDRKKAEEALYQSEKYLSTLTNSIADALFTVKMSERKIEYCNQSITWVFGYSPDELIGHTTRMIYPHEAGFLAFGQKVKSALDEGLTQFRTELLLMRKNGDRFWAEVAVSFIRAGGEVTHAISIVHDITERRKVEEEIRISSQKLSSHLNNSPLAVIEWDKNFVIKSWSIQAERIFEWTEVEVVDKHFNDLNLVFEDDAYEVNTIAEELMTGAVAQNKIINRNITKSGKVVYCQWFNSVLLDEAGQTQSILSLVQDITESKKTEERIIQLNQDLEERVKKRTLELESANKDLKEINELFVGRESRIIELKEEVEELKRKLPIAKE